MSSHAICHEFEVMDRMIVSGSFHESQFSIVSGCKWLISQSYFHRGRKDLPGLAHFLEHMLFTGTAKYPKEGVLRPGDAAVGSDVFSSEFYSCYPLII